MKSKSTPSPWSINGGEKLLIGGNDGKMMLAECLYRHTNEKWKRTLAQAQANARLIAASPELLDIAKRLVEVIARPGQLQIVPAFLIEDAKKAIAKAERGTE